MTTCWRESPSVDTPPLMSEHRVSGSRRSGAAEHVPRGTGREGARSEERAEQRPAPGAEPPAPDLHLRKIAEVVNRMIAPTMSVAHALEKVERSPRVLV